MAFGGIRRAVWCAAALLAVGGLLWLHGATARAAGTTRYVALNGNDTGGTNDCATQASPCKTIANALTHAVNGDTIQLGPGIFATSVTTAKSVTFAGAGAGTAAFDPTKDTAIDATSTQKAGITINNRNVKIEGIRIRGGVFDDMNGGEVLPAVQASGAGNPTLDISDSILLQGSPPNPDAIDYALQVDQVKTTVENSTIVPFQEGIWSKGTGGTLTVTKSTVSGPTPTTTGLFLQPVAAVWTLTPAAIVDSRLSGIQGFYDEGTSAAITRSVILASGSGAVLSDGSSTVAGAMAIRDSIVDVVGNPMGSAGAVALTSPVNSDPTPPSLTLVGDTAFVRSNSAPAALSVNAAAGSKVNVHNTILHAIDTSGHNAANDIHAGNNALNWNVGFSDYAEVAGQGVPAAGSGTNLTAPPDFVNDSGTNLRLSSASTLFDKGDPTIVGTGETDVTGAPRSVPHVCGGPALPDLGAFEAASPPCPIKPPVPTIGNFSQSHKKWRTGSKAAAITARTHKKKHKKKAPVGTTFSFSLNTPSTVTLTFTGSAKGRKGKGGKCVAQTKHNKKKRSCKRTIQAGALTFANAAAGTDSISFDGKVPGHKKLKAGRYSVTIEATNSTGHSGTTKLSFTIVKR